MKSFLKSLTCLFILISLSSCGSSVKEKKNPISKPSPSHSSNAILAKKILAHPKIKLLRRQVSGRVDGASSYDSIVSTACGYSAKRSSYGTAPGGYVKLRNQMLKTMLYLADTKGYSYRVTSIAGGSHSRNSRHYVGTAFDVDMINGRKVRYGNPYFKAFLSACRAKGATEALGPGDRGHSTHAHVAWPRSSSVYGY